MWHRYYAVARISLLALAALTVRTGVLSTGPAYVAFKIDCNRSDIDNETTNDSLTVEFYSDGSLVGAGTSWPHCGKTDDAYFGVTLLDVEVENNIGYVIVRANGSDAFYIDEARLTGADGEASVDQPSYEQWGHDHTDVEGWCLSQDPGDAPDWSDALNGGRCYSCLKFTTDGPVQSITTTSFSGYPYLDGQSVSSCE